MERSISEIIELLDQHMEGDTARLTLRVSDEVADGTVKEQYHHGRCDVGSPWALGTVTNCDADIDLD